MSRRLRKSRILRLMGTLALIGAASGYVAVTNSHAANGLAHTHLTSSSTESYLLAGANGQIYSYGAQNYGDVFSQGLTGLSGAHPLGAPIVAAAEDPQANGYWMAGADGGVYSFGGANFGGNLYTDGFTGLSGTHPLNAPIVGMAADPNGGYWLVAADGGVFSFGGAPFLGNLYTDGFTGLTGSHPLNAPIVGMAVDPSGGGYWLVGADGGVFSFGNAPFEGTTYSDGLTGLGGSRPLSAPIVGIAPDPSGTGYWLAAADGGVFSFGGAPFLGNLYTVGFTGLSGSHPLNKPMVGIASNPQGDGYWLVAADGGVFTFGDAPFEGSAGGQPISSPVVAMAVAPGRYGYDVSNWSCDSLPSGSQSLLFVESTGAPYSYDFAGGAPSGCEEQEIGLGATLTQFYLFSGALAEPNTPVTPPKENLPDYSGSYALPSTNTSVAACILYAQQTSENKSCDNPGPYFLQGFDAAIYSYDMAYMNAGAAGLQGDTNNPWWIDVEVGQYHNGVSFWQTSTTDNYHAILGQMAALEELGVSSVGIYSTNSQWGEITTGTANSGAALPQGTPLWVPDPGAVPGDVCNGEAGTDYQRFGGGTISYVQYDWAPNGAPVDLDAQC